MIRSIVIGLLALTTVAAGIWGYQEHQEKNAVLMQAENNYQKSFHNLTYHIDMLHDKIGTVRAMNSSKSVSPQMVEIWRLTSESLADVSNLPLNLLPFNKTESFLADIGDFTYRASVRDLEKNPLSEKEMASLDTLYDQAADIKDELREVQHLALKNNLRWMDVQLALATADEASDNTIIDGFKTVEKTVGDSQANLQTSMNNMTSNKNEFKYLPDETISEEEARKKGLSTFKLKGNEDLKLTKSGDGADTPLFSLSYKDGDKHGYMDMTQNGGYPLNILVERPLGDKKISLNKGMKQAKDYLQTFDFDKMVINNSSEYDHIGVYSFIHKQDGVKIFPDSVEIKVALDNGDIMGLTARKYFMNHKERTISEPEITVKEARKEVNSDVEIQEEQLAIIENDLGKEVLVHEFLGTMSDDTYRIFINAVDGREERVEKLGGTEINYEGLS